MSLKQRKKLIVNFYEVHGDEGVAYTVKYFLARSTSNKTLKSFQERNTTERKAGSGRKAKKLTPQKTKRLVKAATSKNCVSQAKLAQTFGNHKSYVQTVLKREGCKCYKKEEFLNGLKKRKQGERRCRKLSRT